MEDSWAIDAHMMGVLMFRRLVNKSIDEQKTLVATAKAKVLFEGLCVPRPWKNSYPN